MRTQVASMLGLTFESSLYTCPGSVHVDQTQPCDFSFGGDSEVDLALLRGDHPLLDADPKADRPDLLVFSFWSK